MKKAFSLLEILLVMAIIGLLLAIGMSGLSTLRTNMEAQQAINEVMSYLKDTQNKAKNNTVILNEPLAVMQNFVYGYRIYTDLSDGKLHRSMCKKDINAPLSTWNGTCALVPEALKSSNFYNISISNLPYTGTVPVAGCEDQMGIVFENLTGKLAKYVLPSGPSKCSISISIINPSYLYAWIIFDTTNGTYELQKP